MWRTWPRRVAVIISAIVVLATIVVSPAPGDPVAQSPLAKLLAMPAAAAAAYVKRNPDLYMDLENADPYVTWKWWKAQKPAYRAKAIKDWPQYIGNLAGIDYATRNKCNRVYLASALKKAEANVAKLPESPSAKQTLASLVAIKGALRGSSPKRYLVEITTDQQPLAAIAIGDVDAARQVTFAVPGMGTYTTDMQLWTQSAQNIWDDQGTVGAVPQRAVIAWIGYQTPPPGIDATLGAYAANGAVKVIAAVLGVWAVHRDSNKLSVSIIAHSYGTTTVANAMWETDLGIYAFVMLGSAGIEPNIPNARALKAQHVYAGEAEGDTEARLGRGSRVDPRSPGFGATVFDVDGDASAALLPVTGHAPVLHSRWNDNPVSSRWSNIANYDTFLSEYKQHFTTFGYLDAGTQSLKNAAIATTPTAIIGMDTGGGTRTGR